MLRQTGIPDARRDAFTLGNSSKKSSCSTFRVSKQSSIWKKIFYPAPKEKETLPNFYQRFLQLKAQAPKVSDEQVIAQAIKALRAGPLHNHLIREWPKTVLEPYEQFMKFSKSEIQHFGKLEKQRKVSKFDEALRPRYNKNQQSYPKLVHNIDSNGCGLLEN
jgi:hypothetical protein